MSDSRRRRKVHNSGDSDDLSDSYDELNTTKETQSSGPIEDCHDSEYDTAGSESEAESQEGVLRESGDGQEEEKSQRKLDDDEDRRNPQYIPKRGTFYEHDDRTAEEATESAVEPQVERDSKEKKVWKDKDDKWNHDRYNDAEQAPKSHEELIAVYGYDIRNEEGPPRARRRRRYGRGPNKYTRNWEDEDAYGKISANASNKNVGRKVNKTGEEFPSLGPGNKSPVKVEEPVISSAWYSNKTKPQAKANFPPLQPQSDNLKSKQSSPPISQSRESKISNETTNQVWKKDVKSASYIHTSNGNSGGDDADKGYVKALPRDNNKRNVQESVSLVASRARGRGFKANTNNNIVSNRILEMKPKGRGPGAINPDNRRSNPIQMDEEHQLANDVKHMNIVESTSYHPGGRQNKHFNVQLTTQQRANTVPPRLQHTQQQQQQQLQQQPQKQQQQQVQQPTPSLQDASANRPKRYSSLRQRPALTEGPGQQNFPSPHGQHTFYPPQGYPQGHFEQPTAVAPPNAPMTGQPVIPLPPAPQPSSYAAPPPFLVPPPQFLPPQTAPPNILNYVPGPTGPQFQPNYQGYQGYNPAPVQAPGPPPPQELFQPQGCTYYSPAQQHQQQQQQQPVRRPTAAIPILPPPDNQQQYQAARNRGKITLQHPQQETHQQVLQKHHDLHQQQQQLQLQQQQQEHLQQLEFQKIQFQQAAEQSEQEQHNIVAQHEQPIQYELQEKLFEIEQAAIEQAVAKDENLVPQEHEQELRITQEKELREYEEVIQESQEIVVQENLEEISSSTENEIIDDKLLSDEKSLTLPLKECEDTETFENVNVQTKEIETVAEVHECSVEITEKHPTVSSTVDLISEAPVKLNNAPVVDTIVSSSTDNTVVENGETDGAVLEKPVVEETAA
ncbi:protein CASC3-like isoform X2 [Leptopilina heterotoma]|uniref:protein CASC3-like isoform X2 n=1 Tax=Leptopilina heterotoma TaxID=63436 RepID=UPI001CA9B6AF|nr:protein CASC3-like isoform X2 [Leptopilina heterotoma]